jgi:hypothetical protein
MLLRSCCKFLAVQCDFWGESSLFFLLNVASLPGSSSVFLCARYTWEEFSAFYTGKWPGFRIVRRKTIQNLDSFPILATLGDCHQSISADSEKTVMLWHCGMDEFSPQSDETCHRFPIKKKHVGVYTPFSDKPNDWLQPNRNLWSMISESKSWLCGRT